jgi:hypothetical protein
MSNNISPLSRDVSNNMDKTGIDFMHGKISFIYGDKESYF